MGIVLTLLGFAVAALTWLTVLLSYRACKRSIVAEVVWRVSLDHVWLLDDPRVDDPGVDDPVTGRGGVSDSAYKLPSISESGEGNASQGQGQAAGTGVLLFLLSGIPEGSAAGALPCSISRVSQTTQRACQGGGLLTKA